MSEKQYTYTIGDKTWTQRPLVLGQWQQLMSLIKGFSISFGGGIPLIIETLGTQLPLALAVVLVETDGTLKNRFGLRYVTNAEGLPVPEWYQNPDVMLEIANEIHSGIDAKTIMRVIDDFLSCNPASSILDKLTGIMAAALPMMAQLSPRTAPLTPSSPFSPEATSLSKPGSSGDSLPLSASPISNSESVTSSLENQSSPSAPDSA